MLATGAMSRMKLKLSFSNSVVDHIRDTTHEQHVAIGWRPHDRFGADGTSAAGPVLDDELLAEMLRQPLRHQTRNDVARAGWRERHNHAHRPRRIGLRPCAAREDRQHGSACCQMKQLSP
jgi:hypothetical protein